jgi:hypothetical protein
MTADIDARLPPQPSLDGYKIEFLSIDSVAHLFRKRGESSVQSRRSELRASESEPGKLLTPK